MKSKEIRKKFFDFFVQHGHEKVESSSLIPAQDPTLLFTNAGMNQFKDLFLGNEKRKYTRATSIQKCVRAGGKHNDLDNVGFTKRHLTFFEMMGNFSFGDYFKKEAIAFAWDLLTNGYALKKEDLFVSVYKEDDESFAIWEKEIGIDPERIMRFGKADNFWQMGDTGPCGPCTEIYLDQRSAEDRKTLPVYQDFEDGKLLEIWNLVFMQYNQQPDGSFAPLKQTGVDTGAGLERVACVLQGKDSVFETDLFTPLIEKIEKLSSVNYKRSDKKTKAAFHVLADHVRSSCLIIADGGSPSNEGRGYVLRKIIRRAALFMQKLNASTIFPELAAFFIDDFGQFYPELITNKTMIISLLTSEIEQFYDNLVRGKQILERFIEEQKQDKTITGKQAFKLYDTYGFPLEVTILASNEHGYSVDTKGFQNCMDKQKKLSGKKMKEVTQEIIIPDTMTTEFVGYRTTQTTGTIIGLVIDNALVDKVTQGQTCSVITDKSPFFVATGGQVDDAGYIAIDGKKADLEGLTKLSNGQAIGAQITAPCNLKVGMSVEQVVDESIRRMTMNNHTSTHLLQAALIELLGKQVKQSGSVVTPDYLRFDFTYHKNLTPAEIKQVEDRVNEKIRENIQVNVSETTYKDAVKQGVIAIFGEKYNPECVRVINVPGFSAELCGGTHVSTTGVIGSFKITEVSALSAGNRRIVALTGPRATELMQDNFSTVQTISRQFKVQPHEVVAAVEKQTEEVSCLQKQIKALKKELIKNNMNQWKQATTTISGVPFLYLEVSDMNTSELKDIVTQLNTSTPGFYVILNKNENNTLFYAAVDKTVEEHIDLKQLQAIFGAHGLRGGCKKNIFQGGGQKLETSLEKEVKAVIK